MLGSNALEEVVTPFVGNQRAVSTASVNAAGERTYIGNWYGAGTAAGTVVEAPIKNITITDSVFMAQYSLNVRALEYLSLPDNMTTSYAGIFNNSATKLKRVHFGSGLTAIPNSFFSKCAELEEINIPLSVKSIGGTSAFTDTTALTKVYYEGTLDDWVGITFASGAGGTPLCNGATLYIDNQPVQVGEYTIPAGTTTIAPYTFYKMSGITKIIVPDSVTNYGTFAFAKCADLTEVVMGTPATAPTVGASLFQDCEKLNKVTLPENLVTVGNAMFLNCTGLKSIALPDTFNPRHATNIGNSKNAENMFKNTGLTSITLPSSMQVLNNNWFQDCADLTSVTIPDSVVTIGTGVFQNCVKLTSIVIPDSVTTMGQTVFKGCTALSSVTLSTGLTKIDASVFAECEALTEITIPDSVTQIGNSVFQNSGLTSISIPSSVTQLGSSVFLNCVNLTSVTFDLEGSLATLGANAFQGCTSLTSIIIPSTVSTINKECFYGWTAEQTICMNGFGGPLLAWNCEWFSNSNATVVWDWVDPTTTPETNA